MTGQPGSRAAVTVIGEAIIDLVPGGQPWTFHAIPGGSPYNVAIGLARLGHHTTLMARLADSTFGRLLREHARAEGIGLGAAPHATEPATLAVVSLDAAAQASSRRGHLRGTPGSSSSLITCAAAVTCWSATTPMSGPACSRSPATASA
jgi:sugar/nucleoside kinase (ribokinase family)